MRRLAVLGALLCVVSGCRQRLVVASTPVDAEVGLDGAGLDGSALPHDAALPDAASPDGGTGDGLSPDLARAVADGAVCTFVGYFTECASHQVCSFFSRTEGRCTGCEDPCSNVGFSCTRTEDCDTLSACYLGRCSPYCDLGTTECGPPRDCLDVGHPSVGVCRVMPR